MMWVLIRSALMSEYLQQMLLWGNKKNYPRIIAKNFFLTLVLLNKYDATPTFHFQPVRLLDLDCCYKFKYLMVNSADPDQLASSEAKQGISGFSRTRVYSFPASGDFCHLLITFANSLDPDQARQNVGPDLVPKCLTL